MRITLFLLLFLSTFIIQAQDKLLLMNGQEFECKIVSDTANIMVYEVTTKKGKVKLREVNRSDVFSYTVGKQPEIILYQQDSLFGDVYTPEQMRMFMAGESDARKNFKAHHIFIMGFVICGTIAFVGEDGFLTATIPPLLFTATQFLGYVKIREQYISNPEYKYNDVYAEGFEKPARTRKLLKGLGGSYSGAAAGVLLWFIVKG